MWKLAVGLQSVFPFFTWERKQVEPVTLPSRHPSNSLPDKHAMKLLKESPYT